MLLVVAAENILKITLGNAVEFTVLALIKIFFLFSYRVYYSSWVLEKIHHWFTLIIKIFRSQVRILDDFIENSQTPTC